LKSSLRITLKFGNLSNEDTISYPKNRSCMQLIGAPHFIVLIRDIPLNVLVV
jgi:hypothetical protein